MPIQGWKIVEWSKHDDRTVKQVIERETDATWDYYDAVQIHGGRLDLIFVDRTN